MLVLSRTDVFDLLSLRDCITAGLVGERRYFAAKTNANFSDNPHRFGRPAIQGTIVLADATMGVPLASATSLSRSPQRRCSS